MKTRKPSVHNILLAAAFALPLLAMTSAARADDMDGGRPPMMPGGPGQIGPGGFGHGFGPGQHHGMPPFGSFGGFGGFHGSPVLRGVELTEAQQDKVFAILHDEEPYLRDQAKAAGKAHEALRALSTSDKYDDAKAATLAQAAATAMANITLQHVRTDQKLLALLTPEQRKKQAEERPHHPPRR